MVFNGYPFLIFLPVVFLLYWLVPRRPQNLLIVLASWVFYGSWDWRFLPLLWFSTIIDFVVGIRIEEAESPRGRRGWLLVSVVTQLGLLAVFKYLDFGIRSAAALLESLGFHPNLHTLGIVLPVGISFYTFQTLSYTISVYRQQMRPTRDLLDFCAFVSFFPQLVAGPIERASHMLGQFEKDRRFDASLAADGCRQMLYGLFMKTVVGDNCARIVDAAYGDPAHVQGWSLLFASYLFAFQIYGDFAGYSHMAIGCARLFGFELMRNFAYPYFARSIAEFWHRWHISLSTWFRDFVYIPLGGNRGSPLRRRINVFVTFALSGIWHGAGFNYLIWGAYHGALCAAQWWPAGTKIDEPGGPSAWPRPKDLLAMIVTFHAVCIGWVFFRAADAASAWTILSRIADAAVHFSAGAVRAGMTVRREPVGAIFALVLVLVLIEWVQRRRPHGLYMERLARPARWAVYVIFLLAVVTVGRREEIPFIYFQF